MTKLNRYQMNYIGENLTVTDGNPFVINSTDPSVINFGSITLLEGAEIHFLSDGNLTTQTATFIGNNKIKFIGTQGVNANPAVNAAQGEDGGNAPSGTLNFGTVSGEVDICILAGQGGAGAPGFPTGGNGGKGGDGSTVNIQYGTLNASSGFNPVTPQAPGGTGGRGSKGVNGYDDGNTGLPGEEGQVIIQQSEGN